MLVCDDNTNIYDNYKNYIYKISFDMGFIEKSNKTHLLYNPSAHYWVAIDEIGVELVNLVKKNRNWSLIKQAIKEKYNINDDVIKKDVIPFISNLIDLSFFSFTQKNDYALWIKKSDSYNIPNDKYPFGDIYISLSDHCNLRCIYCFNEHKRTVRILNKDKKTLKTATIISVLEQFYKLNGKGVVFTGGEPTLNGDIIELSKAAVEIGLVPKIITNGTLLNNLDLESLCKYVKHISISLDSVILKEINMLWDINAEFLLGNLMKAFEKINNIASKEPINIVLSPVVSKINLASLNFLITKVHSILTNCIISVNMTPYNAIGVKEKDEMLSITDEEYAEAFSNIFSKNIANNTLKSYAISEGGKKLPLDKPAMVVCAPSFFIANNGDAYPCQGFDNRERLLGNVKDMPLAELFENDIFREVKGLLNPSKSIRCCKCELRFVCTLKGGACQIDKQPFIENCKKRMVQLMYMQTQMEKSSEI